MDSNRTSELSPLLSEICIRLREMDEVKALSSVRFLSALFRLSCDSVPAYSLLLRICTDDAQAVASYTDIASERLISKQAAHKDMIASVECIKAHFPQIGHHIENMRAYAHHGHGNDNQSRNNQPDLKIL